MKIGVIGATGNAGRAIYKEAVKRGHQVAAIVRSREKATDFFGDMVVIIEKNAFDLTYDDLKSFDVIVNAFGTKCENAYQHVDLATKLIAMFRETKTPRLLFILGAGSLFVGKDEHRYIEDLKMDSDASEWIEIAEYQLKELKFLEGVTNVNWVGVSPSAIVEIGENKGAVLGDDELLYSASGKSIVSTGTMAAAILDEIEKQRHYQERFTVCNAK